MDKNTTETTRTAAKKSAKTWQCLECGRRLTLAQAQRAADQGCKCGGYDVDLAVTK